MSAASGKAPSLRTTANGTWTMTSLFRSNLESRTSFTTPGALSARRVGVSQETARTRAYPGMLAPAIELPFGALSVQKRGPLRQVRTDTLGGTDVMPWLGPDKRATTAPTFTFSMTSGEIDWRLIDMARSAEKARIPNFEQQLSMLRARMLTIKNVLLLPKEPMLLEDGRRNYFTIKLYTPVHPESLTITGLFGDGGITETYEGQRPMSMTYEFEFIVLQQEPDNEQTLAALLDLFPGGPGAQVGTVRDNSRAVTTVPGGPPSFYTP